MEWDTRFCSSFVTPFRMFPIWFEIPEVVFRNVSDNCCLQQCLTVSTWFLHSWRATYSPWFLLIFSNEFWKCLIGLTKSRQRGTVWYLKTHRRDPGQQILFHLDRLVGKKKVQILQQHKVVIVIWEIFEGLKWWPGNQLWSEWKANPLGLNKSC